MKQGKERQEWPGRHRELQSPLVSSLPGSQPTQAVSPADLQEHRATQAPERAQIPLSCLTGPQSSPRFGPVERNN